MTDKLNLDFTQLATGIEDSTIVRRALFEDIANQFETGTWIPIVTGSGGYTGQVYSLQEGNFVRIGKLVTVQFDVRLTTLGTITASVSIEGFPFAPAVNTFFNSGWAGMTTAVVGVPGLMINNTKVAVLYNDSVAAVSAFATPLVQGDLSNTSQFRATINYIAI